jgi:plasmid stabilization system protein ParE
MPGENSRIVWAPAAKKDLRDIWRYFEDVASPEVADWLLRDIAQVGERVRQRPLAWRTRDEIMPGLRSILVHPYVLFYRVKPASSKWCVLCTSDASLRLSFQSGSVRAFSGKVETGFPSENATNARS